MSDATSMFKVYNRLGGRSDFDTYEQHLKLFFFHTLNSHVFGMGPDYYNGATVDDSGFMLHESAVAAEAALMRHPAAKRLHARCGLERDAQHAPCAPHARQCLQLDHGRATAAQACSCGEAAQRSLASDRMAPVPFEAVPLEGAARRGFDMNGGTQAAPEGGTHDASSPMRLEHPHRPLHCSVVVERAAAARDRLDRRGGLTAAP